MNITEKALRLIFPPKCIGCGYVLNLSKEYPLICKSCLKTLNLIKPRICPTCGKALDIMNNVPYCAYCAGNKFKFNYLMSSCVYEGSIQDAIINMKFNSRPHIAKSLAFLLYERIKLNSNFDIEVITFAPISSKRLKERGYNQSQLIAEFLGEYLNKPTEELLIKIKDTPKQSTLTYKERLDNLKGSITFKNKTTHKNVLLVDDVYTTGATAEICASQLKKAGVKNVIVATVAVTQKDYTQGEQVYEKQD